MMRIKGYITLLILLLISFFGFSQNRQTKKLITEIRSHIKTQSLVSDQINWKKLDNDLKSLPFENNTAVDRDLVLNCFTSHLKEAGDPHSLFITPTTAGLLQQEYKTELPLVKNLGDQFALIQLPSCLAMDPLHDFKYADTLIKQIQSVDSASIKYWIIDLRNNRGGNVWPMINGLHPIIGDGVIGYSWIRNQWIPHQVQRGIIRYSQTTTATYQTILPYEKIAVLVGPSTASSGEMAAIFMLGKENVYSFGEVTRGFTSSNTTIPLKDGTIFFLARGLMADLNKNIYASGIHPRFPLPAQQSETETIQMLKDWLISKNSKIEN